MDDVGSGGQWRRMAGEKGVLEVTRHSGMTW